MSGSNSKPQNSPCDRYRAVGESMRVVSALPLRTFIHWLVPRRFRGTFHRLEHGTKGQVTLVGFSTAEEDRMYLDLMSMIEK